MKDFIFTIFISIITFSYERVFRVKMSDEVKEFFKNLSYVGFGTIISVIFSSIFNILAGRILGPSGYGEFTLVQSVAMFLYIPMLMGFSAAMIKYDAEKEDLKRQRTIISTTYILVFIFTIVSIFLYYLFSSQISNLFSVSGEIFYLSVVFAVLFVFYMLTTNTLISLHEMKTYAFFQPIYGIILLSSFLVFIFIDCNYFRYFRSMVFSMCLAYGVVGLVIVAFIRDYLKFEFSRFWADRLTRYSFYAAIGGISSIILTNAGKLFINNYMSADQVGIYQAYIFATVGILSFLISPFITVFFPMSSKSDKKLVWAKMKKGLFALPVLIPFIFIFAYFLIRYGYQYPVSYELLLLFTFMSIVYIPGISILGWFLSSFGKTGAKLESYALILNTPIFVMLLYGLVPRYGLIGVVIPIIITSTFIMLLNLMSIRRLLFEL